MVISEEIGAQIKLQQAYRNLGLVAGRIGKIDLCEEYHNKALDLANELDLTRDITVSLEDLGDVANARKDFEKAKQMYSMSLEIAQEINDNQWADSLRSKIIKLGSEEE